MYILSLGYPDMETIMAKKAASKKKAGKKKAKKKK
jgi:hypothetical protein